MPKSQPFYRNFSRESIYTSFIVFWVFLSLPRILLLYSWGINVSESLETSTRPILSLLLGVLRDGLLVGGLILIFQVFHKRLKVFAPRASKTIVLLIKISASGIILLSLVNVEFFRFFGSNFTLSHLGLVTTTNDGLSLFFSNLVTPLNLLFYILISLAFLVLSFTFFSYDIDLFFRRKTSIGFTLLIILIGISSRAFPFTSSRQYHFTENHFLYFSKNILFSDGIKHFSQDKSLGPLLDTLPLETEKYNPLNWLYFDPDYPLLKATPHHLCKLGIWKGSDCAVDADKDGFPLIDDCNDADARIHPNAVDVPRNSVDEDCSGMDANPPNIIFIHWESARAVNTGSIGYSTPATPQFDRLAKSGLLFKNAYSNATQTRHSLISVYCSILPRLSTKWIFSHNPSLNLISFPLILRKFGYHTIYLHGGEINFSDKEFRISSWFETLFDRTRPPINSMHWEHWGLTDEETLQLAYEILSERKDHRPFFIAIPTLTTHYPFVLPDPKFELNPHYKLSNQMANIMHYADAHIGNFINKILEDPKFENTIILIAGDHGVNWFNPHNTGTQNMMWEDLVWVPMALIGPNWNVEPAARMEIRQLADIGPTILDRLGIDIPNPFIGHSLLRSFGNRAPRALFGNSNGGLSAGIREGDYKYILNFDTKEEWLYNLTSDRKEKNNLANNPEYRDRLKRYNEFIGSIYTQSTKLIKEDRIWSWKYWIEPKNPS